MGIPIRTRDAVSKLPSATSGLHVEWFSDPLDSNPFFYIIDAHGGYEAFGVNVAALLGATGLIDDIDPALAMSGPTGTAGPQGTIGPTGTAGPQGSIGPTGPAIGFGMQAGVEFEDGSTSLVQSDQNGTRAVVVVAECVVACAGTNDHATFDVGWVADPDGFLTAAQLDALTVGEKAVGAGILPAAATLDVTVTDGGTADVDDGGEFLFTVLLIPSQYGN
jgi:hypothetical protein